MPYCIAFILHLWSDFQQIKIITLLFEQNLSVQFGSKHNQKPKTTCLVVQQQVFAVIKVYQSLHFLLAQLHKMNNSKNLSPKKQVYNRFAYLLQPSQERQTSKVQKQYHFFDINACVDNPCNNQNLQSEVRDESVTSRMQQQIRKPLKYELLSNNYQLFKQQIEQKSSLNSFIAYTPEKSLEKEHFTISNNQISTIEYTKSNQLHTHRNLFESIFEDKTSDMQFLETQQIHLRHVKINNISKEQAHHNKVNALQNQLIKLQLSQSQSDQPQRPSLKFPKKHMRTMTERVYTERHNNLSTAEKSARYTNFLQQQDPQSLEANQSSKNHSTESQLMQQLHTKKKSQKLTIATFKTKQMSQKLQESSQLEFQNSICYTPTNSKTLSTQGFPKSIQLGRKNKKKS